MRAHAHTGMGAVCVLQHVCAALGVHAACGCVWVCMPLSVREGKVTVANLAGQGLQPHELGTAERARAAHQEKGHAPHRDKACRLPPKRDPRVPQPSPTSNTTEVISAHEQLCAHLQPVCCRHSDKR
jgi:hypothetical protein